VGAVVRGGGGDTRGRCVRTGAVVECGCAFVALVTSGRGAVTVTVTVAGAVGDTVAMRGPARTAIKMAADAIAAEAAAIIQGASREGALRVGVPVIARPESGERPEWKLASAASTLCRLPFASRS